MLQKKEYKFWFCTGSQDLYGDECLAKVAEHSHKIVEGLNQSGVSGCLRREEGRHQDRWRCHCHRQRILPEL